MHNPMTSQKMSNILLLTSTYLLLTITVTVIATDTTSVLDIDNHPLQPNTPYYILPVIRGQGGGLTTTPLNKTSKCPLYVGQEPLEVSLGKTVKFFPLPTQKKITLSSDLHFVFSRFAPGCTPAFTGWRLTLDEPTGRRLIQLGDVSGAPGVKTVSNWFKIEKVENGIRGEYKLVFCPNVCNFCKVFCGNVGVLFGDGGRRLLGLISESDKPLLVMFKKASY